MCTYIKSSTFVLPSYKFNNIFVQIEFYFEKPIYKPEAGSTNYFAGNFNRLVRPRFDDRVELKGSV